MFTPEASLGMQRWFLLDPHVVIPLCVSGSNLPLPIRTLIL